MKIKVITWMVLLSISFLLGCGQDKDNNHYSSIEDEIISLKTAEDKITYLEKILKDDQKVRGSEGQELMLRYGKDSKEYMDYVRAQWKQDEINLFKVEKYLELHGYPKKEFGKNATRAPWMVIHHAQGYDTRERNFEKVYRAYLYGDIDGDAMSFYLGRMYEMKNNRTRLQMENPYTAEEQINKLIEKLDLEQQKKGTA